MPILWILMLTRFCTKLTEYEKEVQLQGCLEIDVLID